ncbi:MAG: BamA/TamA family outer membrane protein [Nevskiales bacterium]|nr:BamA/TamA family outer membrane protein [Nevskiales bacterium]
MPSSLRQRIFFAVLLSGISGGYPVLAQPLPETTGDPKKRAPELQPPAPATPVRPPRPTPSTGATERLVTVSRFTFTGNTVYSSEQLAALLADYTGRPLNLLQIYEAADAVTDFYANNGYTLASVSVPAQKIADGAVRLEVIEGRIGTVAVEGLRRYTPRQVTENFGSFVPGQIYRGSELEEGLHRLNQLPGLQAKAVLQPGDDYGTSKLLVQASEKPVSAALAADNYGRINLGEYRSSLSGTFNNPLRREDQLQLLALATESGLLQYGYLAYNVPLYTQGPRLSLSYGDAQFQLAGLLAGVEGTNRTARAGLEYPLLNTRNESLSVGVGSSYTNADADLVGTPLSSTEILLYDVSTLYQHVYRSRAVSQAGLTLQSNFDSQNSTDCLAPATNCDDQMLRVELDLQHLQPLVRRLDGYVHLNYVYSADPLPAVTQVSLGGPNNVRGYGTAEVRGDRGWFASAGLRQAIGHGPVQLSARAFADSGEVERVDSITTTDKDSLTSAGVGLDALWEIARARLSASVQWSFPLDNHINDPSPLISERDDQRLFATLSLAY